ncbi:ammonium transporter 3-like 1, partial [Homarus americanus]
EPTSSLLEEIFNLSKHLLTDSGSAAVKIAAGMLNMTENVLKLNVSDVAPVDLGAVVTEVNSILEIFPVNLTESFSVNGTHNATVNVTITSRGGGVQSEDDEFGNDAAWILTATFIIFTMQSGFGLLESGCVSMKNETNIMVKNVVDVLLGGFTYWLFGYALSFGKSEWTNPFCGWGDFAINPDEENMGAIYTTFFFQLSFATTATTIVSGAIAER